MALCERCSAWQVPYIDQSRAQQKVYFEEDLKKTYTEAMQNSIWK